MKKTILLLVLLLAHTVVTARAMMDHGYLELFQFAFSDWPARQIFSDLTVSLLLVTSWMVRDARQTGRTVWPYLVSTVLVGSFAPLIYLLLGQLRPNKMAATSDASIR